MSYFVNRELVDRAVDLVKPTIDKLLGSELVGGRKNITIVVIEPNGYHFEYTFAEDPKESWPHAYDKIARAKAEMSQRTGKPSGHIIHRTPWVLTGGDARYAGGAVEDELAVGVSGLPSHWDEIVAWLVFNSIAGFCMDEMVKMQRDENAPDILPYEEEAVSQDEGDTEVPNAVTIDVSTPAEENDNGCPNCGAKGQFTYQTPEDEYDAQGTCKACGHLYKP